MSYFANQECPARFFPFEFRSIQKVPFGNEKSIQKVPIRYSKSPIWKHVDSPYPLKINKIRDSFRYDIAYIIRYALNSISIYADQRDERKGRVSKKSRGPFVQGFPAVAMISFYAYTHEYYLYYRYKRILIILIQKVLQSNNKQRHPVSVIYLFLLSPVLRILNLFRKCPIAITVKKIPIM